MSVFGAQTRFDLREQFPLLTTKKLHIKSIIYELLWFLAGDTNIKYLRDNGVTIWDEWADKDGNRRMKPLTICGRTRAVPEFGQRTHIFEPKRRASASIWH